MPVYVCRRCLAEKKQIIFKEIDISNKRFSRWTPEEVQSLDGYQNSNSFLPFICEKQHILRATRSALKCAKCNFHLNWSYDWTLDWSWKNFEGPGDAGVNAKIPPSNPLGEISIALDRPKGADGKEY